MMPRSLLIMVLGVFYPLLSFAIAFNANELEASFDVKNANQRFSEITSQLDAKSPPTKKLNQFINELNNLAKNSNDCVQKMNDEIMDINAQIKDFYGDDNASNGHVDAKYLEDQKKKFLYKQAQCRLFLIRANESIEKYRAISLSLEQKITFTRGDNIVLRLQKLPGDSQKLSWPKIEDKPLKNAWGIGVYIFLMVVFAIFMSIYLQRLIHKRMRGNKFYFFLNFSLILSELFLLSYYIFMPILFQNKLDNELLESIILNMTLLVASLFVFNLMFLVRRVSINMKRYGFDLVFCKQLGIGILLIYFIHFIGLDLISLVNAPDNIGRLFDDFVLVVSLGAMIYFTLILYHRHSAWLRMHLRGSLLYKIIFVIVLMLLTLDFIGYSILAVNSAFILFSFLLVVFLGTFLHLAISKVYKAVNYQAPYSNCIIKWFGYANEPPFVELLILRVLLQLLVIVSLCFLFANLIGEASYFIDFFLENLIHGFKLSGKEIIPMQWVFGVFVFSFFALIARHIATKISRSQQFDEAEEKQVAFASIILYAGFFVAVIMGVLMAGFSFTSLAIIAGALSVGIGLGLQSIVNNFFSGLILLLEKPIKVGDRIKIDGVEGFVKKISIRSTQVTTPAREDIIIPNSDLITHQVTNYMFSDKNWRIKCELGVAYGSDLQKVSAAMMDVAMHHSDVIKSGRFQPLVLFNEFGDNALRFELWCLIKDVNKKYKVKSELNFALDKAFREQGISIAFPQSDVHLKFDDQALPWKKDKKPD